MSSGNPTSLYWIPQRSKVSLSLSYSQPVSPSLLPSHSHHMHCPASSGLLLLLLFVRVCVYECCLQLSNGTIWPTTPSPPTPGTSMACGEGVERRHALPATVAFCHSANDEAQPDPRSLIPVRKPAQVPLHSAEPLSPKLTPARARNGHCTHTHTQLHLHPFSSVALLKESTIIKPVRNDARNAPCLSQSSLLLSHDRPAKTNKCHQIYCLWFEKWKEILLFVSVLQ